MNGLKLVLGGCLLCAAAIPALAIDVALVPVTGTGGNVLVSGNDITVDPGEAVLIEVRVVGWAPELLRAVQVELDPASLTSASAGTLAVQPLDVAPMDGVCDLPEALCPICGPPGDFNGLYTDACRNRCGDALGDPCSVTDPTTCGGDFLACVTGFSDFFGRLPDINGVGVGSDNAATLSTTWLGTVQVGAHDDGEEHYVSSFVFRTSADARGVFTVSALPEGAPGSINNGSFVRNQNGAAMIQATNLIAARVHLRTAQCCNARRMCLGDFTQADCFAQGGVAWTPTARCDQAAPCPCVTNAHCDDGIPCTIDTCSPQAPGADPIGCVLTANDSACGNSLFCDGIESCVLGTGCVAGTPVNCNDGVACTQDSCNEGTDSCDESPNDAACDDGLFCNGSETCHVTLGCKVGTPPDSDDGIACTLDTCDEMNGTVHTPSDALCDNGVFCDGAETCNPAMGCEAGANPCGNPTPICDENANQCVGCLEDADCDDATLCTAEFCQTGACVSKPFRYADINNDGFVNVADTLCLLDDFAGIPDSAACFDEDLEQTAARAKKDIAPCPTGGDPDNMGDDFINTEDVLATLDVFAGIPPHPLCAACTGP